jgi:tetratricopeptide (TPR) repeat protein
MKSKLLKSTLPVVVMLLFVINVFGQGVPPHLNPKYGADSTVRVKCAMNISLYSEFYKQKNFKDAVKPWRQVFQDCPQASKITFIKGANIYNNLIAREKNAVNKAALIDTLMLIYDKRIETFGDKGTVLSYKGTDLYSYRGESANAEVYAILNEAMKIEGKESKGAVVTIFMQTAVALYKNEELDGAKIIEAYTFSIETLDLATEYNKMLIAKGGKYQNRGEKELANIETSYQNVEALFSESGAANCDALVAIFGPKYDENAENIDWLKKVNKLLNKNECNEHELFAITAEQQYKLEPSAEAAHNLARLFLKKQKYDKAEVYYKEATNLQEDALIKSLYYYEWSQLSYAMENYPMVRQLSYKALENNPEDGKPYIMIGKAYAASKKMNIGTETVEHSAVYWVAVDSFNKAKRVDATLAEQVSELVATYEKYFPKYEEWFMAIGTNEGDPYVVGGWINVTTKVRF